MVTKNKPDRDEELLAAIENPEDEDDHDLEAALAMSDEDVDRELEAQGFDRKKVEADADRLFAEMQLRKKPPSRSRGFYFFSGIAAGLAPAAMAALGLFTSGAVVAASSVPPLPTGPTYSAPPNGLRTDAFKACAERRWQACLDGFDRAQESDPSGDGDVTVQAARAGAMEALKRRD